MLAEHALYIVQAHILPELMELCGGVLTPPSIEEARSGTHESSDVSSPPCIGFEKCDVVDTAVSLSLA
jgi:hypothetical protein